MGEPRRSVSLGTLRDRSCPLPRATAIYFGMNRLRLVSESVVESMGCQGWGRAFESLHPLQFSTYRKTAELRGFFISGMLELQLAETPPKGQGYSRKAEESRPPHQKRTCSFRLSASGDTLNFLVSVAGRSTGRRRGGCGSFARNYLAMV